MGVVNEVRRGHHGLWLVHPRIPLIDIHSDVQALIHLPVESMIPRCDHAIRIQFRGMGVIRRQIGGGLRVNTNCDCRELQPNYNREWDSQGPVNRKYCVPAPVGKVTISVLPFCVGTVETLAQGVEARFVVD